MENVTTEPSAKVLRDRAMRARNRAKLDALKRLTEAAEEVLIIYEKQAVYDKVGQAFNEAIVMLERANAEVLKLAVKAAKAAKAAEVGPVEA